MRLCTTNLPLQCVHQYPSVSINPSINIHQYPSLSISIHQYPSVFIDIHQYSSISINVHQHPSASIGVMHALLLSPPWFGSVLLVTSKPMLSVYPLFTCCYNCNNSIISSRVYTYHVYVCTLTRLPHVSTGATVTHNNRLKLERMRNEQTRDSRTHAIKWMTNRTPRIHVGSWRETHLCNVQTC